MRKGDILRDRIGEENTNFQGVKMRIIDYRRMDDIDVLFLNGYGEIKKTRYCHFISGKVKSYSVIIGKSFKNKFGDVCTAIGIVGTDKVKVKYDNGIEDIIDKSLFNTGSFKRPKERFSLSDKVEIPEHKGYYADKEGHVYNSKGEQLVPVKRNGYLCVSLPDKENGKFKQYFIHRLVASAFIKNINGAEEVNHKDGNKRNNKVSNLEWVSRSENQKHRFAVLKHSHFGEKNTQAKITGKDAIAIVELSNSGYGCKKLSEMFNIAPSTICGITSGRSWAQVTNIEPQKNIERMRLMGYIK